MTPTLLLSELIKALKVTPWSQWLTQNLCKRSAARLIRPIIPLCRHGKWTEKLWQPDANHRKQAANPLGACQLTQTYIHNAHQHIRMKTLFTWSQLAVHIVCVCVCVYFAKMTM